jgi:hypothetical protein
MMRNGETLDPNFSDGGSLFYVGSVLLERGQVGAATTKGWS